LNFSPRPGMIKGKTLMEPSIIRQKTKIVATLGPASSDQKTLRELIRNGMTVARLNMSHGSREEHRRTIEEVRRVAARLQIPVAILQDLSGPKIRIGNLPEPVSLVQGQAVRLGVEPEKHPLFTEFKPILKAVRPGERILIDDGLIELEAIRIEPDHILCRVVAPGTVHSRKGVNLPDQTLDIPVFTPRDREDLFFGISQDVDFVAMSFVNSPGNIRPVRRILKEQNKEIPIIAKIERPMALTRIDEILDAFDGIMIARGDLGVEVAPEQIPIIQKELIRKANHQGKLVITATQMLDSMIQHPRPTRAEASDVSNAILDGSDLIMLSGETSVGKHPVKSVTMMHQISLTTETSRLYPYHLDIPKTVISPTEAIVKGAAEISADLKARCILVYTQSGKTALLLSKYRPACPIFGFTPDPRTQLKLAAYWGINPCRIDFTLDTDRMLKAGESYLKKKRWVSPGDLIVSIAGVTRMVGATNMLRITRVE